MPTRLRRKSKANFSDALQSLANAFQAEADRQQSERIEIARNIAIKERERMLLACPVSWPATMTQDMTSNYHPGFVAINGALQEESSDCVAGV